MQTCKLECAKSAVIFRENISGFSDYIVELLFEGFAQRGQVSNIEYMLENGYDPTSSDAFYFAAESGYLNILELFVDHHISYRHLDDAIFAAESNGYIDVVQFLKSL